MKKFKESRTSPRQIYRTVNGLRNDLQHESTEELKVLVDQTLFQFGLKYDGDIYRRLNTGKEYPYHVWKALPTQNLTQRWLIGIWPGFDGHDYQFRIYAADTLDQIKNNEVEPLAEYEGTNSIDELISDLEDAFKYFINEDFKEFQKYPQDVWDQMVKEGRVDENGNLKEESFELIVDENDPICDQFHICSRGDFDVYVASLDHPLDESKNLKEGCLDHIKDKWQSELDKGAEPKTLMDPWAVCEGMKWLGKDGWIRVEEVLTPTEYEEPYPDFYMEIFDQHTCAISHDIYTINEINFYVRNTKARLVNNGIKSLVKESRKLKERVLDFDAHDEYYDAGVEAYFEGRSLSEVPITGNAWFSEAWKDGWKDAKACDDEDARREIERLDMEL